MILTFLFVWCVNGLEFQLEHGYFGRLLVGSDKYGWSTVCYTNGSYKADFPSSVCLSLGLGRHRYDGSSKESGGSGVFDRQEPETKYGVYFSQEITKIKCTDVNQCTEDKIRRKTNDKNPCWLNSNPSSMDQRSGDLIIECQKPNKMDTKAEWSSWTEWSNNCDWNSRTRSRKCRSTREKQSMLTDCQFYTSDKWIESEDFSCPLYSEYVDSASDSSEEINIIEEVDYDSSSSSISTVDSFSADLSELKNDDDSIESKITKRKFDVDDEDYQMEGSSPIDSVTMPTDTQVTVTQSSVHVLMPTLVSLLFFI